MQRDEFCAFVKEKYGIGRNRANQLFDLLDKDNSGHVERSEIESLAENSPPSLMKTAINDVELWCAFIFLLTGFAAFADLFIGSILLVMMIYFFTKDIFLRKKLWLFSMCWAMLHVQWYPFALQHKITKLRFKSIW